MKITKLTHQSARKATT